MRIKTEHGKILSMITAEISETKRIKEEFYAVLKATRRKIDLYVKYL